MQFETFPESLMWIKPSIHRNLRYHSVEGSGRAWLAVWFGIRDLQLPEIFSNSYKCLLENMRTRCSSVWGKHGCVENCHAWYHLYVGTILADLYNAVAGCCCACCMYLLHSAAAHLLRWRAVCVVEALAAREVLVLKQEHTERYRACSAKAWPQRDNVSQRKTCNLREGTPWSCSAAKGTDKIFVHLVSSSYATNRSQSYLQCLQQQPR